MNRNTGLKVRGEGEINAVFMQVLYLHNYQSTFAGEVFKNVLYFTNFITNVEYGTFWG